jgi:hypothetical protein
MTTTSILHERPNDVLFMLLMHILLVLYSLLPFDHERHSPSCGAANGNRSEEMEIK